MDKMTGSAIDADIATGDGASDSGAIGAQTATERRTSLSPQRSMRPAVSRVRMTFTKGPALRYIGHLDLVRAWERALRRAGLPVAWTHGFTPRIRLSFAAPLSLGVVGERELADLFLTDPVSGDDVQSQLRAQLPAGCDLLDAVDLPVGAPSLTSQVEWAQYEVSAWLRPIAAPSAPILDVVAGSRWSRRVPDDATMAGQTRQDLSAMVAGAPVVNGGPSAASDQDTDPVESRERGSDPRPSIVRLIADPLQRGLGADGSPLRPASEWLTPEDPDPGPPSPSEAAERLRQFLAATSVVIERKRSDGHSIAVDVREAVIAGATVAAVDRFNERDWYRGELEADRAPRFEFVVRHSGAGAGRPEDVMAALGYEARWITRRAIGLHGDRLPLQ